MLPVPYKRNTITSRSAEQLSPVHRAPILTSIQVVKTMAPDCTITARDTTIRSFSDSSARIQSSLKAGI
jgi:hypothetical protein